MSATNSIHTKSNKALKRSSQVVGFIAQVDEATTINEVGSHNEHDLALNKPVSFKGPHIGDKERERKWIHNRIRMKVCRAYQEDPKKSDYCKCGRKKLKEHTQDAILRGPETGGKWKNTDKRFIETLATTAFGEIEFPNANIAKYVRVSDETDMDDMMHLLTDIWGLHKPNLLISVTGGAKRIVMSKRLKDTFKKGLLKTAQTTGAWIVTGGNNHGVMKYVGEAVSMLQTSSKVVAFGIAPWGTVMNKKELTNEHGCWPAYYEMREEVERSVNLDTNHTHYILVDNGTFRKFGGEIEFRGVFEKFISQMMMDGDKTSSTNVPVVSIVVEGGPGTLTTVKAAIDNATPVVILEGSGRAADMLAYAYNNTIEEETISSTDTGTTVEKIPKMSEDVIKKLNQMVQAAWPDKNHAEIVNTIVHCVMRRHLIVVFSLEDNKSLSDIDVAILHAIMKANTNDAMNQLKLALAWNRIDVVKDEIFTDDKTWSSKELDDILLTALIQNKPDFVELLMDHTHLGSFLTIRRLLELYNSIPKNHLLYRQLLAMKEQGKNSVSLENVGELIRELVGDFYSPLYLRDPRYHKINSDELLELVSSTGRPKSRHSRALHRQNTFAKFHTTENDSDDEFTERAVEAQGVGTAIKVQSLDTSKNKSQVSPIQSHPRPKREYDFSWPARELFLWSVLMGRKELAMLFMHEEKYVMAPALTAARMLRCMLQRNDTVDSSTISEIEVLAQEFEHIAHGVLGECFTVDEEKAKTLLIKVLPSYGQTTLLQLAVEAENKQFISHQCSQNLLNNIWWGKMNELQGTWRLLVSMVCPPLLYFLVKFRDEEELKRRKNLTQKKSQKEKEVLQMKALESITATVQFDERGKKSNSTFTGADPEDLGVSHEEEDSSLTWWQKLIAFFNAPKVTFYYNTVFYIVFLALFTYMMLCDFHPDNHENPYDAHEITIAVWVATLFMEEFRQFLTSETSNIRLKFWNYISDVWNIVDLGTVTLFCIGYTLRIVNHQQIYNTRAETLKQQMGIDFYDEWMYFQEQKIDHDILDGYHYCRIILSISLMAFFFRVLHILSVFRNLGPKLVMIGRMMKDLSMFAVILAVFIIAYGITQQAILYPNESLSSDLVIAVVRKSYWQMYGELFLEDIEGQNDCTNDRGCLSVASYLTIYGVARRCQDGSSPVDKFGTCSDNSTYGCYASHNIPSGLPKTAFPNETIVFCYENGAGYDIPECQSDLPRCPLSHTMVSALLGGYILFTQILMFNLLIAMFSYTFELVQDNTDLHWMYQRYFLIMEYYTRPPAPPPLIVINHIGLLARAIFRKCRSQQTDESTDFRLILNELTETQLTDWEKMNSDEYNRKRKDQQETSIDYQVSKSKCDLDVLMSNVDGMRNLPQMYDRVATMEKKMNDTSEALNWIMDALAKSKMGQNPPLLKTDEGEAERKKAQDEDDKLFQEWKVKKEIVHRKCRQSPYVNAKKVSRFPVPDKKLYWEIGWPDYRPVLYTDDAILTSAGEFWVDKDIMKMPKEDRKVNFNFNMVDGDIDRKSVHGGYKLDAEGLPLNPFGRTGLMGRGSLGHWGPNHALDAIMTRWRRFEDGSVEMKAGKKVLEFIAVKRKDVEEWAITGIHNVLSNNEMQQTAVEAVKSKALHEVPVEQLESLDQIFSQTEIVYQGYIDDPRNTDNAWIETVAYHFHDNHGITRPIELKPGDNVTRAAWVEVSKGLLLFGGHSHLINVIAKRLDCFY